MAVFSLLSGQMMHVSEQAASILNCKKKMLDSSRFVELLAPEDVGIFYTYINQSHLPLWNVKAQKGDLLSSRKTPLNKKLYTTQASVH